MGTVGVLVALAVPGGATASPVKQYVLKHPKHEHCKAQYVKKAERVKRQGEHGRTIKVRETLCIYIAPRKAPIITTTPLPTRLIPTTTVPPPTPTLPAPNRTVTLRTHLSFVQSPTNPAAVTYRYSASATVGAEDEPNLPAGVLNLYSEGLLMCSVNVGGSITGGECPVVYSEYGMHTVVLTYSSGSTSVTETYQEKIEEPKAKTPETTHTSLEDTFIKCHEGEEDFTKYRICTFDVSVTTVNQNGVETAEAPIFYIRRHLRGESFDEYPSEVLGARSNHVYELNVGEEKSANGASCWISIPELYWSRDNELTYCFPAISVFIQDTDWNSGWIQLEA
jgi:hypothetical protein